jgi:hypothetical protein
MRAARVRWLAGLASWVREAFASPPLTWADYAATKDWDMAEKLWREEQAEVNLAAVRLMTERQQ